MRDRIPLPSFFFFFGSEREESDSIIHILTQPLLSTPREVATKVPPLSSGWCHLEVPVKCDHVQAQPHLTDLSAWGPSGREEGRGEQSRKGQRLCNQKGPFSGPQQCLGGHFYIFRSHRAHLENGDNNA